MRTEIERLRLLAIRDMLIFCDKQANDMSILRSDTLAALEHAALLVSRDCRTEELSAAPEPARRRSGVD